MLCSFRGGAVRACWSICQERDAKHPAAHLTTDVIRLPRKPQMKVSQHPTQRFVHLRKCNTIRNKLKDVPRTAEFAINLVERLQACGRIGGAEICSGLARMIAAMRSLNSSTVSTGRCCCIRFCDEFVMKLPQISVLLWQRVRESNRWRSNSI